jgi:hypothetical protein
MNLSARTFLSWILFAMAWLLENFASLTGIGAITYGAFLIYTPAGWIVGGLLLIIIAEISPLARRNPSSMNGANSGAI